MKDIFTKMCVSNDFGRTDIWQTRIAADKALSRTVCEPSMTKEVLITSLFLLDRMQLADSGNHVTSSKVGEILVGCVMVVVKWLENHLHIDIAFQLRRSENRLIEMEQHILIGIN